MTEELPAGLLPRVWQWPVPGAPQPGQASTRLLPLPSSQSRIQGMPLHQHPALGTARSRGADTICDPQEMCLPMQHLGTCSSQTPEFPAEQPQAPRLLHAQMPKEVTPDRSWSLARAAPAQAAFPGRVLQAQPWRGAPAWPGEGLRVLPAAPTPLGAGRALKGEGTRQNTGQPLMIIGLGYVNAEL